MASICSLHCTCTGCIRKTHTIPQQNKKELFSEVAETHTEPKPQTEQKNILIRICNTNTINVQNVLKVSNVKRIAR